MFDEVHQELPSSIYRSPFLIWKLVGLGMVICIFVLLGALVAADEGVGSAALLLFAGAIFFLAFGVLAAIGSSNIVVDKSGISRLLFGVKINEIAWGDVLVIKSFPLATVLGGRAGVVGYNVVPRPRSDSPRARLWKIWFVENPSDIGETILAMNYYIALHEILVEKSRNGAIEHCSAL